MNTKAKLFLGKLLIVFSVFLVLLGITLMFSGDEKILHPIYDVTIISKADNETVSITTVAADEEIIDDTATKVEKDINPSDNAQSSVKPSVEDVSLLLRNEIEKTYGVTVKYASETNWYSVGGMSTTPISNPVVSQNALINLNAALSLYPQGFFQEIKSKGYPLTLYLIERYSTDNVTGVTDSSNKNVVISVATDYDFIDTFHHEVYHYIERYILNSGGKFTSWNSLNPAGFKYGVIDSAYSYSRDFSQDAFFVNSYAMTDQYEDRASTFEYMMKTNKASCFNYGKTIWLKARTMSEQIDYFFNTVTPTVTEYWERHIY